MLIAFAPKHNTPGINKKTGKPWKDATGAFVPEAVNFLKHHRQPEANLILVENDKSPAAMKAQVFAALDRARGGQLHGVAFFCHGLRDRIQFGIRKADIPQFVQKMNQFAEPGLSVTFYCCDTGRDDDADRGDDLAEFGGDNGFADKVRDELCLQGNTRCIVDSHTSAAHTTMNPDVRRFEGMGSPFGGVGGYYIVPRGAKTWSKWRNALKTDFRFQFPYMTTAQIHEFLAK